jgi:hypothetical protein
MARLRDSLSFTGSSPFGFFSVAFHGCHHYIDMPVFIWTLNLLRLIRHDQISLFRAPPHIFIEFLELSSGFLGYFCLWIIFSGNSPVEWLISLLQTST